MSRFAPFLVMLALALPAKAEEVTGTLTTGQGSAPTASATTSVQEPRVGSGPVVTAAYQTSDIAAPASGAKQQPATNAALDRSADASLSEAVTAGQTDEAAASALVAEDGHAAPQPAGERAERRTVSVQTISGEAKAHERTPSAASAAAAVPGVPDLALWLWAALASLLALAAIVWKRA